MNLTSDFHVRLREALQRRGMSQTELARRLEVRVATVNEWLNRGTMPSGPVMLRLPGILEVDGHWLLTGERRTPARGEPVAAERRDRAVELLEEVLRVLGAGAEPDGREREEEYGWLREPNEGERLTLDAVERARRAREQAERRQRGTGP